MFGFMESGQLGLGCCRASSYLGQAKLYEECYGYLMYEFHKIVGLLEGVL